MKRNKTIGLIAIGLGIFFLFISIFIQQRPILFGEKQKVTMTVSSCTDKSASTKTSITTNIKCLGTVTARDSSKLITSPRMPAEISNSGYIKYLNNAGTPGQTIQAYLSSSGKVFDSYSILYAYMTTTVFGLFLIAAGTVLIKKYK